MSQNYSMQEIASVQLSFQLVQLSPGPVLSSRYLPLHSLVDELPATSVFLSTPCSPPPSILLIVGVFFRPTPYGFRQVVQHVSKHVAFGINWLIKSRKGRGCSGRKSKLSYALSRSSENKKQNTRKQNNKTPKTKTHTHKKQHKPPSSDVTVTSLWVKKINWGKRW